MPSPSYPPAGSPALGLLSAAGQILGPAPLGQMGVGQPGDVTCVISFTGTFASAQLAIEGVPLGQPLTQPTTPGPQMGLPGPLPQSASEWVPIQEISIGSGSYLSSPITLSSAGGASSGFAGYFPCAFFVSVRVRLISIGSGAVQGGIAFLPFPLTSNAQSNFAQLQLELERIRMGMSILISGGADAGGFDLHDLTAADFVNYT